MIPNAQESFAKKTPALTYYTLTKLHMTKGPEEWYKFFLSSDFIIVINEFN